MLYHDIYNPHGQGMRHKLNFYGIDLTGTTLLAVARRFSDETGAPILTFTTEIVTSNATWNEHLLTDDKISIPVDQTGTDVIVRSEVTIISTAANTEAIPVNTSGVAGDGNVLVWDLRVEDANKTGLAQGLYYDGRRPTSGG